MKVKEFIKWLAGQDQEAEVECVVRDGATISEVISFEPKYSDYVDFRGNKLVHADNEHYEKSYLLIGCLE